MGIYDNMYYLKYKNAWYIHTEKQNNLIDTIRLWQERSSHNYSKITEELGGQEHKYKLPCSGFLYSTSHDQLIDTRFA